MPDHPYKLIAFDLDGTLIDNHLHLATCEKCEGHTGEKRCSRCRGEGVTLQPNGDYGDVRVLSGRPELIAELRADGIQIAVCTNQGGVAFGYQQPHEVGRKSTVAFHRLGLIGSNPPPVSYHVCYTHPNASVAQFREDSPRRKPGPGMILEAMEQHDAQPHETLFVGDLDVDRRAAEAAGVEFTWAWTFFNDSDADRQADQEAHWSDVKRALAGDGQ